MTPEIENDAKAMLAAWRICTKNPHARYPCENFKAGWVARGLFDSAYPKEAESIGSDGIRDYIRRLDSYLSQ